MPTGDLKIIFRLIQVNIIIFTSDCTNLYEIFFADSNDWFVINVGYNKLMVGN